MGNEAVRQALAAIESKKLAEILCYWDKVRGDRPMPGWGDIDAAALKPHLPILWSWKYDRAADQFTGRLAGEEINVIFGKSLRNAKMAEFFADWDYETIFRRHKRVVVEPCIAVGKGKIFIHAKRYGLGERIIMPLAENGVDGDGLIGATIYRLFEAEKDAAASILGEEVAYYPL